MSTQATEKRTPMRPVRVDALCPKCGVGLMQPTGTVLTSYPAQYPHRCTAVGCDGSATYLLRYPGIDYEPVSP